MLIIGLTSFLYAGLLLYDPAMLAECGPMVSPATTQAIIGVESGGNPLAIGDNTERKSHFPKSRDDAVSLASSLLAQGHSIDIGLMQVNSCHIPTMKLSLEELFDPCQNIRIGTTILADFYRQYKTADPVQSLFRALSAYNTGKAWKGAAYVNRILQAAGANYRVLTPQGDFPASISSRKTGKQRAAASSLFFENLSTTMRPADL